MNTGPFSRFPIIKISPFYWDRTWCDTDFNPSDCVLPGVKFTFEERLVLFVSSPSRLSNLMLVGQKKEILILLFSIIVAYALTSNREVCSLDRRLAEVAETSPQSVVRDVSTLGWSRDLTVFLQFRLNELLFSIDMQ